MPVCSLEDFKRDYKNFKKLQNDLLLLRFASSVVAFYLIYLLAAAIQLGIFKKDSKLSMARIVEITALITSFVGLCIGLTNYFYAKKKKEELFNISTEKIKELEKNPEISEDEIKKNGLEALKAINQSLKPENYLETKVMHCTLVASAIFVAMEIFAVTELFKPFGLGAVHAKLGLFMNIQGIVDSVGLVFVLASSLLMLYSKRDQENCNGKPGGKAKEDPAKQEKDAYVVLKIAIFACSLNLFGKVIQGMEAAKSIALWPSEGGSFPIGFTIRSIASFVAISILFFQVGQAMDKNPDSKLNIDALYALEVHQYTA